MRQPPGDAVVGSVDVAFEVLPCVVSLVPDELALEGAVAFVAGADPADDPVDAPAMEPAADDIGDSVSAREDDEFVVFDSVAEVACVFVEPESLTDASALSACRLGTSAPHADGKPARMNGSRPPHEDVRTLFGMLVSAPLMGPGLALY